MSWKFLFAIQGYRVLTRENDKIYLEHLLHSTVEKYVQNDIVLAFLEYLWMMLISLLSQECIIKVLTLNFCWLRLRVVSV